MIIVTSDLHLTDNINDAYRFGLFKFLRVQVRKNNAKAVFILGDITDFKDEHRSKLVNRIVKELKNLSILCPVYLLTGNHDGYDPKKPFFQFINEIRNLTLIVKPTISTIAHKKFVLLPFTKEPEKWDRKLLKKGDFIFMHQTVEGVIASNSFILPGMDTAIFKGCKGKVISGDIHVPQTIGPVTYVGAPYTIRFNDTFKPRILRINQKTGKLKNLYFDCLRKHTINIKEPEDLYDEANLTKGDQVKIKVHLKKQDIVNGPNIRSRVTKICAELELDNHGVDLILPKEKKRKKSDDETEELETAKTNKEIFIGYCKQEKIKGNLKASGLLYIRT